MPTNLTGISNDIWGGMNMGGQTMNQLSEAEQLQRKKKIMAASRPTDTTSVMQYMFGPRMGSAGVPNT